jgi:hypothetical protein
MTSWPLEEYHKVMDRGKTRMTLDGLLCMALQDAINCAQRGNRRDPLLCKALLDRCGTPLCAVLHQSPTQGDDVLCKQLRRLVRLAPWLGAPPCCPSWIVSLVARFPFIEPTFCAVQVAADRFDFVSGQIARDRQLSAVFLRVAHHCLLMPRTWHPVRCDLFSMSWHAVLRAIPVPPDAPGTPLARARRLPLPRLSPPDDSA